MNFVSVSGSGSPLLNKLKRLRILIKGFNAVYFRDGLPQSLIGGGLCGERDLDALLYGERDLDTLLRGERDLDTLRRGERDLDILRRGERDLDALFRGE